MRGLVMMLLVAGCRQVLGLESPSRAVDGAVDVPRDATGSADAPRAVGSLAVTEVAFNPGDVNLTMEGTTDWVHWGLAGSASYDHMATGSAISNATARNAPPLGITALAVTASWTNGVPDPAASMTATGLGVQASGALTFTVAAGVVPHTLRVYTGAKTATVRVDVALSDGSAPAYTDSQISSASVGNHYLYTCVYQAATDGQTLDVTVTDTSSSSTGFAELLSATLQ